MLKYKDPSTTDSQIYRNTGYQESNLMIDLGNWNRTVGLGVHRKPDSILIYLHLAGKWD
jgi:coproporphyrinogen III oxidase